MERETDNANLIALCVSLAAHTALIVVCAELFTSTANLWLPGYSLADRRFEESDVIVIDRAGDLGDRSGSGTASNTSIGRDAQLAPLAPLDQVFLSRDPAGPGKVGNLPSMSLNPEGPDTSDEIETAPAGSTVAILPAPIESSLGAARQSTDVGRPSASAKIETLHNQLRASANLASARPTSSIPAADPAPMSESESDPFSSTGAVDFRNGKMEVRLGRAFKSIRPRLSVAAQLDLLGIKSPRIVLKIAVDDAGKVTKVDVLRSTGSKLVDQPVTVAMYDWWFEPAKDANGKPIADELIFPITWH